MNFLKAVGDRLTLIMGLFIFLGNTVGVVIHTAHINWIWLIICVAGVFIGADLIRDYIIRTTKTVLEDADSSEDED